MAAKAQSCCLKGSMTEFVETVQQKKGEGKIVCPKNTMKKIVALIAAVLFLTSIVPLSATAVEMTTFREYLPEDIMLMQNALTNNGYSPGKADGIYGNMTETALLLWAEEHNVDAADIPVDPIETTVRIYQERTSFSNMSLMDDNTAIQVMQHLLTRYGFYTGIKDGMAGKQTISAFNDFMEDACVDYGLSVESVLKQNRVSEDNNELPKAQDLLIEDFEKYIQRGNITPDWFRYLLKEYNPVLTAPIEKQSRKTSILRIQTRLAVLGYFPEKPTGEWTEETENAIHAFQHAAGIKETDCCDIETQKILFSKDAPYSETPVKGYVIRVNTVTNRVTVLGWSGTGHNHPVKIFKCSCGTAGHPTIKGSFSAEGPVSEWYFMYPSNVWVMYAYRISGPYYFHSVLFRNKNDETPTATSVANLGVNASHGCVRLSVENAKWIYEHAEAGTKVIIE